jgi:alkylhydroperoxidase family enzyme
MDPVDETRADGAGPGGDHGGGHGAGPGLDAVLRQRPDLYRDYRRFYGLFYERALVPRDLLEMVRLHVAMLHDCASELALRYTHDGVPILEETRVRALLGEGGSEPSGDPGERACLALARRFVQDVHGITDAEFAAARAHLGVAGTVALVEALALFDGFMRLRNLLGVEPVGSVERPVRVPMPTTTSPALA